MHTSMYIPLSLSLFVSFSLSLYIIASLLSTLSSQLSVSLPPFSPLLYLLSLLCTCLVVPVPKLSSTHASSIPTVANTQTQTGHVTLTVFDMVGE